MALEMCLAALANDAGTVASSYATTEPEHSFVTGTASNNRLNPKCSSLFTGRRLKTAFLAFQQDG